MADRPDRSAANNVETGGKKPAPAANEAETTQDSESTSEDQKEEEKLDSRLAMYHREAEVIAQNLKESGTRR